VCHDRHLSATIHKRLHRNTIHLHQRPDKVAGELHRVMLLSRGAAAPRSHLPTRLPDPITS
jgi:hypothetical protein